MKKKIKLRFAELEKELDVLSIREQNQVLGGGDPDYSYEVQIYGGTIVNHGTDGVMYRGDDGQLLFLPGVQVATNSFHGDSAYQLSGTIYIGENWRTSTSPIKPFDINILVHEYGHYLQQMQYGTDVYLANVALPSFISASTDLENHDYQWYEIDATDRGQAYLVEYAVWN